MEGYDCIKVDFSMLDKDGRRFTSEDTMRLLKPYFVNFIEERVSAVREAVGPNVDIIMQASTRSLLYNLGEECRGATCLHRINTS